VTKKKLHCKITHQCTRRCIIEKHTNTKEGGKKKPFTQAIKLVVQSHHMEKNQIVTTTWKQQINKKNKIKDTNK
jgi:hypothetical protein